MPELERVAAVRIVATPATLDAAAWPANAIVLRTAPDEVLLIGGGPPDLDDPWAIVVPDAGWSGVWMSSADADRLLDHACAWRRPTERPAFAQGLVAELPVKLWFEQERTLLVVASTLAAELADRADRIERVGRA